MLTWHNRIVCQPNFSSVVRKTLRLQLRVRGIRLRSRQTHHAGHFMWDDCALVATLCAFCRGRSREMWKHNWIRKLFVRRPTYDAFLVCSHRSQADLTCVEGGPSADQLSDDACSSNIHPCTTVQRRISTATNYSALHLR